MNVLYDDGGLRLSVLVDALTDLQVLRIELDRDGDTYAGMVPVDALDDIPALTAWINHLTDKDSA